MNYWWVNQNQTYAHEVGGGYLWSPKKKANGAKNYFYDTMTKAQPGDILFSFSDTMIKAIGVVSGPCETAPKPAEFGSAGGYWAEEGWLLPVEFTELRSPVRPKEHMGAIAPTLPDKYAPLQRNGDGLQGVYLTQLPEALAKVLKGLLAGQVEAIAAGAVVDAGSVNDAEERRVQSDPNIKDAERIQLIKARVGQGLFRSLVELREPACRLTAVTEKRLLRASHIKPWAKSTNAEKLDGDNGLLLAPHVDLLFDRGLITFQDDGCLLVSPRLSPDVLAAWALSPPKVPRRLSVQQAAYMDYHRAHVFKN